jgi:mRNA interferase MazF
MAAAPERGDLVWLEFGSRVGHEQAGHRPALVLSPAAYNRKVGLALICPVTSAEKGYPFEVRIPDGLRVRGVVLADQVSSLDWHARSTRFADRLPAAALADVLARARTLLA